MNYPKKIEWRLLLAAIAALPATVSYAQDEAEEIFELSPFEVSANNDEGYRATSTLAGSRLNTNLKDVAAPVSVLTSQFLDDIGATDIETAMAYVVGVETDLTTDFSTVESGKITNNSNTQPGNNRVRGLARADVTMDFFSVSNGNLDRYNVDRVTLVRGPNSVLFGLGSPAGILDYSTKRATTNKDSGEVQLRFDNFGSIRTTVDFNRAFSDTFAVRVMALNEKNRSQFSSSYENDRRITAAFTYKPWEKTTLRGSFEGVDTNGRRPTYSPPKDDISGWIAAGRPTWDPVAMTGSNVENPALDTFQDFNTTMVQVWDGDSSEPLYTSWASSQYYTNKEGNVNDGTTNRTTLRSQNPADVNLGVGYTLPGFTDPKMFPIFSMNLGSIGGVSQSSKDHKYNLTLTQKFTDNLYVELGAYKDELNNDNIGRSGANEVQIDVNETLIENGAPNPNFLRPYISSRGTRGMSKRVSETVRGTISYELDFSEKSDRFGFLGKHNLSGLYTVRNQEGYNQGFSLGTLNDDPETFTGDWGIYRHWVWDKRYIGDAFLPGDAYPTYTGIPTGTTYEGQTFTLKNFLNDPNYVSNPSGGPNNDGVIWSDYPEQVTMGYIAGNGSYQTQEVTGKGVTLQSYFWGGKIVALAGWRTDEIASTFGGAPTENLGREGVYQSDNYTTWDDGDEFDPDNVPVSGDTSTTGIVFHPFQWMSMFYNKSDNFDITPERQYANQEIIPNSSGEGQDVGIVFKTNDGKVEMKLNYFETSQLYVQGASGIASRAKFGVRTMERLALRAFNDHRLGNNGGEHGIMHHETMTPEVHEDYFFYRAFDPTAPDRIGPPTTVRYFGPDDVEETVDYAAQGYEFEMTYNPTRNWRIAFNASKSITVQTNIGPGLRDYVSARLPVWERLFGIKTVDSNGVATYTNGIMSQNQNPATTNQDSMYKIYYDQILLHLNTAAAAEGKRNVGLAEYSANLITNYEFKEGRFKGLSIGANARWREGSALGYPVIPNENGDGEVFDLDNPYLGDSSVNIGVNASYRKKMENFTWITRFDLKNLVGDDKLVPSFINPDGQVAGYRIGREPVFEWSNTFRF